MATDPTCSPSVSVTILPTGAFSDYDYFYKCNVPHVHGLCFHANWLL